MNESDTLCRMKVEILKALASPTRLRIAELLRDRELCVNDIVNALGVERTSVSKHLALLQRAVILDSRREGVTIYYRLKCSCIVNMFACMEDVLREQARSKAPALRKLAVR